MITRLLPVCTIFSCNSSNFSSSRKCHSWNTKKKKKKTSINNLFLLRIKRNSDLNRIDCVFVYLTFYWKKKSMYSLINICIQTYSTLIRLIRYTHLNVERRQTTNESFFSLNKQQINNILFSLWATIEIYKMNKHFSFFNENTWMTFRWNKKKTIVVHYTLSLWHFSMRIKPKNFNYKSV